MKILLVNPYQNIEPYLLPNLGLGYISSALINKGHDVSFVDCNKERINKDNWRNFLQSREQYEVIGIQMYTYNYSNVCEMFEIAKDINPNVLSIVGGPHINADALQTLKKEQHIDYAICGEGERALPELLNLIHSNDLEKLDQVSNLVYRKNGETIQNARYFEPNLDELAFPTWDFMKPDTYPKLSHGLLNKSHPIAPIFATRGCPFSCTYCSASVNMGKKLRSRSPDNIVDEIELLVKEYGVKEIHFEDDNFTFKKDFALQVCNEIMKRNLKFTWSCPNGVRLDTLDEELLIAMEKAGCYNFSLGIESGSENVLKTMKKGNTPDKMLEKIKLIRKVTDIRIQGFFIFGFPGETMEDLITTEKFMMTAPLHRIVISMFKPLPGTTLFKQLEADNKIPQNYNWGMANVGVESDITFSEVPAEVLWKTLKKVTLKFYLRPRIIFGILEEINSLEQLKVLLNYLLYLVRIRKSY